MGGNTGVEWWCPHCRVLYPDEAEKGGLSRGDDEDEVEDNGVGNEDDFGYCVDYFGEEEDDFGENGNHDGEVDFDPEAESRCLLE
jgi:hypothetical protein